MDLIERHEAVHAFLEEQLWLTLEALVDRDIARASVCFERFARVIGKHMAFEDREVLPRYAPLAPAQGPARLDHVQGDHTILQRHVDEGRALIAGFGGALRDILRGLPTFYRLINVLEHHTVREKAVYGALVDNGLADDAVRRGLEDCLVDVDASV